MNEIIPNPDDERAATWMRQFAEESLRQENESMKLPDPQLLWWKAQALRRLDAERATAAAFDKVETMQIAGSIAAAVFLLLALLFAAPGKAVILLATAVVVGAITACVALPFRDTGMPKRLS